jgi:Divergent InlB B-repeat domain
VSEWRHIEAGPGALVVAGDATNSVIINGSPVIQARVDGPNALLAEAVLAPRRIALPLPRHAVPPTPSGAVDREDERAALLRSLAPGTAIEIHGVADIGKTVVLLGALVAADPRLPDGIVYVYARHKPLSDLLQEVYDGFFEHDPPVLQRDQELRRTLAQRRALVVFDAIDLDRQDAGQLSLALPGCALVLAARGRTLGTGPAIRVAGLDETAAVELVEQELGRALTEGERAEVRGLWQSVDGHPFRLLQAAEAVRDGNGTFAEAAGGDPALAEMLTRSVPANGRDVVALLAALQGEAAGIGPLTACAGLQAADVAAELARRRVLATGSPRYRVAGATAGAPPSAVLDAEPRWRKALTGWAAEPDREPADVLEEAPLLLDVFARAVARAPAAATVALARAIDGPLAWGRRWGSWGEVLEGAHDAAVAGADPHGEAWALHQLGTRAYCLGDAQTAVTQLEAALALRERIRDREGAAATRHNLDFILRPPGGAPGSEPHGPRPGPRRPWLSIAAVLALAGVGAAIVISGGGEPGERASTTPGSPVVTEITTVTVPTGAGTGTVPTRTRIEPTPRSGATGGGGDPPGGGTTSTTTQTKQFTLTVDISGGDGTVTKDPEAEGGRYDEGTTVTLHAQRGKRVRFLDWGGDCSGSSPTCTVTMDQDRAVQARFVVVDPRRPEPGGGTTDPTTSEPGTSEPTTSEPPVDDGTIVP